jgi:hypothetical protein
MYSGEAANTNLILVVWPELDWNTRSTTTWTGMEHTIYHDLNWNGTHDLPQPELEWNTRSTTTWTGMEHTIYHDLNWNGTHHLPRPELEWNTRSTTTWTGMEHTIYHIWGKNVSDLNHFILLNTVHTNREYTNTI